MATSISQHDFDYIRHLVRDRAAIVLEPGKEYLVESRMLTLLNKEKLTDIKDLVVKMKANSFNGLHDKVVDALTTNETSFFRDIHPFETLKKMILPEMIEKRMARRELNIWCGASSSGQEPFTIALLLRDHFPELRSWTINFMASDISVEMLDRCKRGAFSQLEVNRGLPAPMLIKYFERQGMEWIIKPEIRSMIEFKQINLSNPFPPMNKMDIIFLRNVLIYFDVEMKKEIMSQLRKNMNDDGYLFLGAAESTLNLDTAFERVPAKQSGAYRITR